jgi:hypothetical protein
MNELPAIKMIGTIEPKKFMRLPAPGERDPLFGFSRSFINGLILPGIGNNFTPPVASYVIKKPTSRCGVRLVDVASMEAFIAQHAQPKVTPPSPEPEAVVDTFSI